MEKKKVVKKKLSKKNVAKKNGFTLIELLAVIIILGILMIIAIPSVTKYISDSRKSAYIDTAKEIVSGTRNKVNDGKLGMYDTNATYYIPSSYIQTENASKSPYGEFTEAYVGVTYNGTGYDYYWISTDDAGQGVSKITPLDKLETDDIESDLTDSDITGVIETTGIGNRDKILILDPSTETWREVVGGATNNISEDGGVVVYPIGKTKETVAIGDIVKIGSEEFYVVKHDGNDLVLLAHYNLKVGNIITMGLGTTGEYTDSDPGYGLQSSEAKGAVVNDSTFKGTIEFSSTNYWNGKVGNNYPGAYCNEDTNVAGANCAYVYDSNSTLKSYVDAYKSVLEKKGATIKKARILKLEELLELGCANEDCTSSPSWVYETSYWLGSAYDNDAIWFVATDGELHGVIYTDGVMVLGIRPVIVI